MNVTSYPYYKRNYTILKFLRLWNTDARTPEILFRVFVLYCFFMCTFLQIAAFCTSKYTLQDMSKKIILIHGTATAFNKYLMLQVEMRKVKLLFARIEQDWKTLENMEEYNILKNSTMNSKFMLNAYISVSIPLGGILATFAYVPIILDIVAPLDEPRPRKFLFIAEFFIFDPAKHFISLNIFVSIVSIVAITVVIVADGSVVMFIMHNCAMFKIAGYRLQRAINTTEKHLFHRRFARAVFTHQEAIEFADIQKEIYSIYFSLFLVSGTCSTTMTIYSLTQAIKVTKNTRDIMSAVYNIIFQFSYVYLGHLLIQLLINHSTEIFTVTCDTQWYSLPVSAQKLIVFIMMRSTKPCVITLLKIYQGTYEGFTMICNMSMSYLMFLCSI